MRQCEADGVQLEWQECGLQRGRYAMKQRFHVHVLGAGRQLLQQLGRRHRGREHGRGKVLGKHLIPRLCSGEEASDKRHIPAPVATSGRPHAAAVGRIEGEDLQQLLWRRWAAPIKTQAELLGCWAHRRFGLGIHLIGLLHRLRARLHFDHMANEGGHRVYRTACNELLALS